MNYLLNHQKNPYSELKIPDGLPTLMSDICREILREQPTTNEIYSFSANYLEDLVETRDKIQITSKTVCDIIDKVMSVSDLVNEMNGEIASEKANKAITIIKKKLYDTIEQKQHDKFNQNMSKDLKEVEAITELVKKCELTKNQVLRMKPVIQKAFKNCIDEYFWALRDMTSKMEVINSILKFTLEKCFQDIPSVEVQNKAATSIQAAFKGYKTRKIIRKTNILLNDDEFTKTERVLENLTSKDYNKVNKAAITIQRAYRKYTERTANFLNLSKRTSSEAIKEIFHETICYDDYIFHRDDVKYF